MAFVRVREESLEEKRMHCGWCSVRLCYLSLSLLARCYGMDMADGKRIIDIKVVQAFESALALLGAT